MLLDLYIILRFAIVCSESLSENEADPILLLISAKSKWTDLCQTDAPNSARPVVKLMKVWVRATSKGP